MLGCPAFDLTVSLVLFAGACIGHVALLVTSHNWWYGLPLARRTTDVIQLVHGLLMLAFPLALWLTCGVSVQTLFDLASGGPWPWPGLAAAYVVLCWVAGFLVLPAITISRCLRPHPPVLVESRSQVLDVARELGYRPIGDGKHQLFARLPFTEVFQVEFVEHTLSLPRLPAAWEGLTLLHLSDLHLCGTPDRDFFRMVLDRCAAREPDLIAITGDVVDSYRHQKWIVPLLGRLRWKTAAFAILGNHDYWYDPPYIRRRLARIGMQVVSNVWKQIEVRGEPLVVVGHEGPWLKPVPNLADCPEGPFRLCLSHTPDNIGWARRAGIDLMLAGHVHGGQVRLPLIGSVFVPSRLGRRYDCGLFDEGPTTLYVSRGLGGEQPLRWRCRPEVTLFTLRRAEML
jgi:predicted MPP superfamily phosphohydrolase